MSLQLFIIGTAIIFVSVAFHVVGLVIIADAIQRISIRLSKLQQLLRTMLILGVSVFGVLFLHVAEGWAWAAVYLTLGEFSDLSSALYFSIVTSTTLGYGDIVLSEQWQLLSTFEAMGGLILFGTTTAFLLGVTGSLFNPKT